MHEMSIVESLLETVQSVMRDHPGKRVGEVRVRVGSLRLVVPETLQFCFAAASRGGEFDGARLVVTTVPALARCGHCGIEFPVEENWFACPRCGAADGSLRAGNELELSSIETMCAA
jgi:hydrogenase nickel incorporation protein HypA/HybF